jgi:Protein of unknown function (DUF2919)
MNAGPLRDEAPRFGGRRYPLDLFDRHLSLKAPPLLLVCLAFLCNPVLLRLASALSSLKGQGADISLLWSSEYQYLFMLGSLPTFGVLVAYLGRAPDRGPTPRWLWRHGAWLACGAALVQSIPALLELDAADYGTLGFAESPLLLGLNAAIIGYLLASRRVRDAFSDFPVPAAK